MKRRKPSARVRERLVFGPTQLVIVLLIVLLLFGTRLPGVARSLGLSITEFKKGVRGIDEKSDPGRDRHG